MYFDSRVNNNLDLFAGDTGGTDALCLELTVIAVLLLISSTYDEVIFLQAIFSLINPPSSPSSASSVTAPHSDI